MITISNRTADFNELKIENLTKRPLLDALKVFWKNGDMDYINFLESNQISYFKEYSRIDELKDSINDEIEILKNLVKNAQNFAFDFKIADSLKKLAPIKDHEFCKFSIDFRTIQDKALKQKIKDIFLTTKSVSLIDFMEVTEDTCSLYYSKKGAFYYEDEPYFATAREQISMLENYKVPKDNNFIIARFLQDLAFKFKENGIDESFVLNYADNQGKNIKSVEDILKYANLSREEKQELKEQEQIANSAKQIAKAEIKAENNATRNSLNSTQANEKLNEPQAQLYNISNTTNLVKFDTHKDENSISEIVARNIEIIGNYEQEIAEIDNENKKLCDENKTLKEDNFRLNLTNENLQKELEKYESEIKKLAEQNKALQDENLQIKNEVANKNSLEILKLQMQNENLANKEQDYKNRILSLEDKNNALEDKIHTILSNFMGQNTLNSTSQKELRSKDILGETKIRKD